MDFIKKIIITILVIVVYFFFLVLAKRYRCSCLGYVWEIKSKKRIRAMFQKAFIDYCVNNNLNISSGIIPEIFIGGHYFPLNYLKEKLSSVIIKKDGSYIYYFDSLDSEEDDVLLYNINITFNKNDFNVFYEDYHDITCNKDFIKF